MSLTPTQWLIGGIAALIIGFSKTGVPGAGILAIPLIASLFVGRSSLGATLPLLLGADIVAVLLFRRHARWDELIRLAPSVLVGFAFGIGAFLLLDEQKGTKDLIGVVIGWAVLIMVVAQVIRMRLGDRLTLQSRAATAGAGIMGGFATMVSNAAGPIMQIYLTSQKLDKMAFMGTASWFFFIFNSLKIPFYIGLAALAPDKPFFTTEGLTFCLILVPVLGLGTALGRWTLHRLPQRAFTIVVLVLSAVAAVRLILAA